jgi:hypothetical protein
MATPRRCGTDRRTPKFAPEARSMRLLGPGVMDITKAKPRRAGRRSSVVMEGTVVRDAPV